MTVQSLISSPHKVSQINAAHLNPPRLEGMYRDFLHSTAKMLIHESAELWRMFLPYYKQDCIRPTKNFSGKTTLHKDRFKAAGAHAKRRKIPFAPGRVVLEKPKNALSRG